MIRDKKYIYMKEWIKGYMRHKRGGVSGMRQKKVLKLHVWDEIMEYNQRVVP